MADNLNIGARMTIDASQFKRELLAISREMAAAKREFANATASMNSWTDSVEGASERQALLHKEMALQERRVIAYSDHLQKLLDAQEANNDESAKTRRQIERATKDLENAMAAYQRYQRQLWEAEDAMSLLREEQIRDNTVIGQLTRTMMEQEKQLDALVMDYQEAVAQFGTMSTEARVAENRMESMNNELKDTRKQLERLGRLDIRNRNQFSVMQLLGIGTASQIFADVIRGIFSGVRRSVREATQEFIDFESAFAGVKRTVEGSIDDFSVLRREILTLGTELATPVDEIADIAAIAGQMGIGVDQISEFTRVMIQLGDTTNVSAQEAGESLAQLSNLLGLTTDEYEKMGSAIVQLGNEYPTTEQDIIDMSSRLAGMAGQVSMSAADVLGLANALAAVGLEAEMGGNTVSKTLREMLMAVENNTEALALFASTAGMSVSEFSKLFNEDATQALARFVEGLDDVDRNGRSATQILRELGITETRQIDTLLRLAGNSTLLAESIDSSNRAWDENVALAREAAARYETTASRIEMMKNAWRNFSIGVGEFFSPAINTAIDISTWFAEALTGSENAAYHLNNDLNNLTSALADYKEANETAAESVSNLTQRMMEQASVSAIAYGTQFAVDYKKAYGNVRSAASDIDTGKSLREEGISMIEDILDSRLARDLGITNTDEFLAFYSKIGNMSENALSDLEREAQYSWRSAYGTYMDGISLIDSATLTFTENMELLSTSTKNIRDLIDKGLMDDVTLSNFRSNLDDKTRGMFDDLLRSLQDTEDEARESIENYLGVYSENDDMILKFYDYLNEQLDSMLATGNIDSMGYALMINQRDYLEPYVKEIEKASKATQEFVSNTENVPRVSDIIADFRKDLANTQDYNLTMGITGDDAARDEMSDYQSVMRKLIEERSDYNDALKMGNLTLEDAVALAEEYDNYALDYEGEDVDKMRDAMLSRLGLSGTMTNEVFREYLEQWMIANEELDAISEEYFSKFSEQLSKDKAQSEKTLDEIIAEYREANERLIANEKALGDLYDFDSEKAKLLESTLTQILNIPTSMRPEDWDMYADAISRFLKTVTGEPEGGDTPYDKLSGRYTAAQVLWEGMGGVADSQLADYQKSLKSTLENIYNESFGLDWDSLTDEQKEQVTDARETLVDQIQQLEEDVLTELEKLGNEWDTLQIRIGNRSLVDPEMLEKYDQSLVSSLEALYREYLTIDPKILDETARANIEAIEEKYKELTGEEIKAEPEIEGNWWSRTKESANKAMVGEENWPGYQDTVAGIQELVGDISDIWDQLGGGILDIIDSWYMAQIDAIDRMTEKLEESLEREQSMLDYGQNKRQAELNAQLREGLITEEQYNLASMQNKQQTEAAKYEAEMETNDKLEELSKKREELERKQFEADKANQIAQVLMNAAQAIAAAWTNPITAPFMTAAIAGMAAAQTAIIASQKYTPALAKGGIVTSPTTALIGEAGAEAVMPLENNTEWIYMLADQLSSIMSSGEMIEKVNRNVSKEGVKTSNISNKQEFTQIINSPKPLSRIEIYRDTRRIFQQFGRR